MRLPAMLLGLIGLPAFANDCTVQAPTWDTKSVECSIPAAAGARSFEFVARYAGSHDDTLVRIEPSLDGKPLACRDGSTIRRFAEDGDNGNVSLNCRFGVDAGAAARLQVTVRWHHAEYTDFQLLAR